MRACVELYAAASSWGLACILAGAWRERATQSPPLGQGADLYKCADLYRGQARGVDLLAK